MDPTSVRFFSSGVGIDTFTSELTESPYRVSFDWDTFEEASPIFSYQVCTNTSCGEPVFLGETGTDETVNLEINQSLRFSIDNTTGAGDLIIQNFTATQVPAPLPAAGAATAFSFSRRLRRRTKARDAGLGSGRPRILPHPTTYLNLSATTVTKIPVSFTYPALRQSDRDVA